jgi:hypothetical protein
MSEQFLELKIKPTFFLRGIDIAELHRKYQAGIYSTLELSNVESSKRNIIPGNIKVSKKYRGDPYGSIYSFKDTNNTEIISVFSNHKNFEIFHKNDGKQRQKISSCDWCRRQFSNLYEWGVPIINNTLILNDIDPDTPLEVSQNKVEVFYVEGDFCGASCVMAHVDLFNSVSLNNRDPLHTNAKNMLSKLISIIHGNKKIVAAKDWRLLECNNGSLTEEEWENPKYKYTRTTNLIIIPIKVSYLRENNETS